MFMVLKKKKIVVFTVTFLLLLSCYLSFGGTEKTVDSNTIAYISSDGNKSTDNLLPGEAVAVSGENNYFLKTKNDREVVRSKATELLRSIIDDDSTSDESKKEAENSIIKMANDMDKEMKIESLLGAKGFKESVAFISDNSVTITIKSDKLSDEDMAKINDIVYEITGNNSIKIVEVN